MRCYSGLEPKDSRCNSGVIPKWLCSVHDEEDYVNGAVHGGQFLALRQTDNDFLTVVCPRDIVLQQHRALTIAVSRDRSRGTVGLALVDSSHYWNSVFSFLGSSFLSH